MPRLGMLTLFEVNAGEIYVKGYKKNIFRKFFIISLKIKAGTKGKTFSTFSFDLI
jgi:hypothetical protein